MKNSKKSSKQTNDDELEHLPQKRVKFDDENEDRINDHDIKEEENIRKLINEENFKDEQIDENYQNKNHSKKIILDQVDEKFFMTAYQKNQYHCFLCGKYYKNSYFWIRHIKVSECNFQCIVCNQSKMNTNWNLHQLRCLNILKRVANTGFKFEKCKRKKNKKIGKDICVVHKCIFSMSEHINLQNQIIKKATEDESEKESKKDNQMETNSDDNCDKSFLSTLSDVKLKYAKIELKKDDLNLKNDEFEFICKSCDGNFCTYKNFMKHIKEDKLHCKLCDKGFCKYEQLARHQKNRKKCPSCNKCLRLVSVEKKIYEEYE